MERKNTWLIFLLVLIILGLGGYVVYDKVLNKDNDIVNNGDNDIDNDIDNDLDNDLDNENKEQEVELTANMFTKINNQLNDNKFTMPINALNNKMGNVFQEDSNRFFFTTIFEYLKGMKTITSQNYPGAFCNLNEIKEKSRKLFDVDLDISKLNLTYHEVDKNYVGCGLPSGIGGFPEYEVNSLTYNNATKIYTMKINIKTSDDSENTTAEFKYKSNSADEILENSVFISLIYNK